MTAPAVEMGTRRIEARPRDGRRVSEGTITLVARLQNHGALGPEARVGRYELVSQLGSGGMADVWCAIQSSPGGFEKRVALKTIKPALASDPRFRKMFRDEACVAARVRHANVVEVLDLGEEDGVLFQAMSLVEGGSLAALLRASQRVFGQAACPAGVVARIVSDALRGLEAAHSLRDDDGMWIGVVHRDVCPANVLIGFDGVAKIADFGIARAGDTLEVTDLGERRGKRRYAAPERRDSAATPRSDLYSMAVVLWEALTGCNFDPAREILDPRALVPSVPDDVAAVTMRGLARSPHDRFSSAGAMADALERAARASGTLATSRGVAELMERCFYGGSEPASVDAMMIPTTVDASAASGDVRPSSAPPAPRASWLTHAAAIGLGLFLAMVGAGWMAHDARRADRPAPTLAAAPRPVVTAAPAPSIAATPIAATPIAATAQIAATALPAQPTSRVAPPIVELDDPALAPALAPHAEAPARRGLSPKKAHHARVKASPPRAPTPPARAEPPVRPGFGNPYEGS
jgi:serine/threonine protein kinase